MSKITSKNLSYDNTLPPFLQRMRGDFSSSNDGRHEFTVARPKRPRNADLDAEDEPTYVDESNEMLTKEAVEKLKGEGDKNGDKDVGKEKAEEENGDDAGEAQKVNDSAKTEKVKIVDIGEAKKRKVGRVVGGGEDADDGGEVKSQVSELKKSDAGKAKRKGKKIKLSFNEDDGV